LAHCKLSPSQETKNDKIQNQIVVHLFFDSQGIVHKEFVRLGQTVNQSFHREFVEILRKRVERVDQALHAHGCCTTTTHHVTRQFLSMNFWEKKPSCGSSAPTSQDLSPCDFFLFPRLNNHLKGRHFATLDNIQNNVTEELKGNPEEAF